MENRTAVGRWSHKSENPRLVHGNNEEDHKGTLETGKLAPTPPPQLYQVLRNYAFPGNVRELRGIVFDAVSRHTGGVMSLDVFKEHIGIEPSGIGEEHPETFNAVGNGPIAFGEQLPTLKAAEDALVEEAMKRCDNNQSQAARLLGITPSALNKRLNKA